MWVRVLSCEDRDVFVHAIARGVSWLSPFGEGEAGGGGGGGGPFIGCLFVLQPVHLRFYEGGGGVWVTGRGVCVGECGGGGGRGRGISVFMITRRAVMSIKRVLSFDK